MSLCQWDVGNAISFGLRVYEPTQRRRQSYITSVSQGLPQATSDSTAGEPQLQPQSADQPEEARYGSPAGADRILFSPPSPQGESSTRASLSNQSSPVDYVEQLMRRGSSSWWNSNMSAELNNTRPEIRCEPPSSASSSPVKASQSSPRIRHLSPRAHPHKHNILIAINDEPIDIIKARCNSTDCGHFSTATSSSPTPNLFLRFTGQSGHQHSRSRWRDCFSGHFRTPVNGDPTCETGRNEDDALDVGGRQEPESVGRLCLTCCREWSTSYLRDLMLLLVAYALVHAGFKAQQNVDSSLFSRPLNPNLNNQQVSLGPVLLTLLYTSMGLSCLGIPIFARRLPPKASMFLGLALYATWIFSHSVSTPGPVKYIVLGFTSVLAGLGHALSWSGQLVYLDGLFTQYYASGRISAKQLRNLHFVFLGAFQLLSLVGNLVVFLDPADNNLSPKSTPLDTTQATPVQLGGKSNNSSDNSIESMPRRQFCEAVAPCAGQPWSAEDPLPDNYSCSMKSILLLGTLSVLGALCCLLLKSYQSEVNMRIATKKSPVSSSGAIGASTSAVPLHEIAHGNQQIVENATALENKQDPANGDEVTCLQVLLSTVRYFLSERLFLCLIPVIFYYGMMQATLYADFNKSYVACPFGVPHIGLSMVLMVLGSSISSVLLELVLVPRASRQLIFIITALLHGLLLMLLLLWAPGSYDLGMVLLCAALWGAADGAWAVLNNVLMGSTGVREGYTAFIIFRMVQILGSAFSFFLSIFLGLKGKAFVLLMSLLVAGAFYSLSEYHISGVKGRPSGVRCSNPDTGKAQESQDIPIMQVDVDTGR